MTLEDFLGNRYRVTARLPALTDTHQRYVVESTTGMHEQQVLSFCDYVNPLSPETLERQRKVVDAMARPPVALLCRVTDSQMQRDHQWVVSEHPGDCSLRELLQQRQSLSMEEVEAFLRLLMEACEGAVGLGWPKLNLEASHLFIDGRLGLPRIPAPDVPMFEAGGTDTPAFDPMATMQFNAADLRSALEPLPKDTRDYVLPLAALCCDLLGQPQSMRGGNARYQPVPQLTSHQNVLLRRALTSEGRAGFTSAKAFIEEFFGVSMHHSLSAHTERLRSLTATMSGRTASSSVTQSPVSASMVTVRRTGPVSPPPLPQAPTTGPLTTHAKDRETLTPLSPTLRLRLMPSNEEAPVITLVADERIYLGRSASDADFIAQFRPRSNTNDGRSRRISRVQTHLSLKVPKIVLEESAAVNPSVIHDSPIPGYAELDLPGVFLLAGEYPVEVRAMPSDYDQPREIADLAHKDEDKLQGAIILRPGGAGVLLCEVALVFSDVGIHFSKSGRPWLRVESGTAPAARVHRLANQFWLEPVETATVSATCADGLRSKTHELVLLTPGVKLRLGQHSYTVQAVTVGATV